jgi:hypothetical protein
MIICQKNISHKNFVHLFSSIKVWTKDGSY